MVSSNSRLKPKRETNCTGVYKVTILQQYNIMSLKSFNFTRPYLQNGIGNKILCNIKIVSGSTPKSRLSMRINAHSTDSKLANRPAQIFSFYHKYITCSVSLSLCSFTMSLLMHTANGDCVNSYYRLCEQADHVFTGHGKWNEWFVKLACYIDTDIL